MPEDIKPVLFGAEMSTIGDAEPGGEGVVRVITFPGSIRCACDA
jgi:hypothetical protein